jgi:hypothetical protein
MDLSYTAADLAFRDKVRGFLAANLPADLQKKVRNHLRLTRRSSMAAPAGPPPSAISGKRSAAAPARRRSCRLASTWWRP